jgi:TIR domain-containing protein
MSSAAPEAAGRELPYVDGLPNYYIVLAIEDHKITKRQRGGQQMRDKIFISYRRADSDAIAQKLYGDLKLKYGADRIYFDVVGTKIGFDFGQRIANALNDSAIILVIIGSSWAKSFQRKTGETDWVQVEVAHAIGLDAAWRVIPVLAETGMPSPGELPESINKITRLHAISLSRKANEWGPGIRALHREINKRGVKQLPLYAKPGKRLIHLQHHEHHFLTSPNQTGEALVHALSFWNYNILSRNEDEGTVTFNWGANDHVSGRAVQWLYEKMHKEGTDAIIERDITGSVLNLSMPTVRYLAGAATVVSQGVTWPLLAAAIPWERQVVKRFFRGMQRSLDGLDPGPDPLLVFDRRR